MRHTQPHFSADTVAMVTMTAYMAMKSGGIAIGLTGSRLDFRLA